MKLDCVKEIREKILALEDKLSDLRDVQGSIATTHIDGLPKAKKLDSSVERIVARIAETQDLIDSLQVELAGVMIDLSDEISRRVKSSRARKILHRRYVCCDMFKEIAVDLRLSQNEVFYYHRKACKEFNSAAA